MKIKNYKKHLFISFIVIMFIFLIFAPNESVATYSLNQLQVIYPTGMQWNDDYHGNRECHGFACLMYDQYYGISPLNRADVSHDVEQVQPGDVVRYNGHTVWILSRNGENVTVAECNYDWQNHVRWNQPKTMNELRNNFNFIYKAPWILNTIPGSPTAPSNVSVDTSNGVEIKWNKGSNCYGYKIEIYDASNKLIDDYEVGGPNKTSVKVYELLTGTYTVKVCSVGYNGQKSSYVTKIFSAQAEAQQCHVWPAKKLIEVGNSFQYNAIFYPSDGTCKFYYYAGPKTDTSIVKVESDGHITALKKGTTVVYYNFETSRTTLTNSCEVTVVGSSRFKEMEKSLNVGEKTKLELYSEYPDERVYWTSSDTNVATVDNNGNITAKGEGTCNISARQTIFSSDRSSYLDLIAMCSITVIDPNPKVIEITGVSINKVELNLEKGETLIITATVKPSDTTQSKIVTWSSNRTSVATVDATGKVTAVGAGTATITAKTSNGKTATCSVNVTLPTIPITSVTLSKTSLSLTKGGTSTLTATVNPSNTTNSKTVTWTSSNTAVATVLGGKVTAVGAGTATITVKTSNGKTATCSVTVKNTTTYILGDINKDGKVNARDAKLALQCYVEKIKLTDEQKAIGDVNKDGKVNARDAKLILQYYVGKIKKF